MEARIGILTISDTRSAGQSPDLSGPALEAALASLGFAEFVTKIVPDEIEVIQEAIRQLALHCQAVFTTGGTGFSPRDVTPEATAPLLDQRADNLSELIRLKGAEKTPMAFLSRGIAGMRNGALIVNLPGSPKAVREGIEALGPILPDLLAALAGRACSHGG